MRKILLTTLMVSVAIGGFAKSEKRGVSENQFTSVGMLEVLEPGVTWYYNWGNAPGAGVDGVNEYEGIEFVPMCWSNHYNADVIRNYCKAHPDTKYLLGFNEPNFTAQSNLTPQQAAEEWPNVKALADELGLKLVAPALNYSPNPPYTDPLKWMDEFVALVGIDAFDFTAIHNYGGLGVMKTLAGNFHDRYGKPVWVTEFCYWPNEGNSNSSVLPSVQINSIYETVEWLETTEWIYRYAWFKAYGSYDSGRGPNYGLLKMGASLYDPWDLSPQGYVYTYMSDYDTDKWHPVSRTISATDYVVSKGISLSPTADVNSPCPIEISSFNTGAEAVWQFDVPKADKYNISLKVSGYGEPTRFDPNLQWVIVEGENERALTDAMKFELPNSDTFYETKLFTVDLPQGHVKLKLKDVEQYKPSGIRISTLRLDEAAGVEKLADMEDAAKCEVYNLQGIRVGTADQIDNLPKGIYLLGNGQKVKI